MNVPLIRQLVKADIGMMSASRDEFFDKLIEGIVSELTEEKGIILDENNANHQMFIADYASWKFQNRDSNAGMPNYLRLRMRNLFLHSRGT